MTKKHFIALADAIREHNNGEEIDPIGDKIGFARTEILALADFCAKQNHRFDREGWLGYIAGTCGKNGGKK